MALRHARSGDVVDVRAYGAQIGETQSFALFKAHQLEVMRLVLPAGHRMPTHQVPGEVTLQCLEGQVRVDVDGQPRDLPAGHLMHLAGGVPHALQAEQTASVLVTIAL